jgi:6-phosphogluconolactonase (cycloisomerase 2 family)
MHGACGVIYTECMVHAVSLTPHAQTNFLTTLNSENHMQNSDGMQKKSHVHAVSMTPHAQFMQYH